MFLLFTLSGYAAGYKGLTTGGWQIRFDDQKGGVSLFKKSKNKRAILKIALIIDFT